METTLSSNLIQELMIRLEVHSLQLLTALIVILTVISTHLTLDNLCLDGLEDVVILSVLGSGTS